MFTTEFKVLLLVLLFAVVVVAEGLGIFNLQSSVKKLQETPRVVVQQVLPTLEPTATPSAAPVFKKVIVLPTVAK